MSKPLLRLWLPAGATLVAALFTLLWLRRDHQAAPLIPAAVTTAEQPAAPTSAPIPTKSEDPLAAALTLPDPRARAVAFAEELHRLIARDPMEAAAALRRMPRGPEFTQGLFQVLDALARRDPEAALALANELARSREEQVVYNVIFDRFAHENLASAAERLARVPAGEPRENAARTVASAWSRADPAGALAWAEALADPSARSAAVETALGDLAQRDPHQAVEIARRALRPPARERAMFAAIQRLAATDPAAAAPLVAQLPPGDEQTMLASHVARVFAERDTPAALAWVKSIPIDLTRWMAHNSVLTAWVQRDRTAAARHVLEMPPGQGTEFAASHLAQFLASDPADAILWAAALPDDNSRIAANAQIASAWAQRAPAEAVRWAASLNEDPLRPNALGGAFSYWMLHDADAAMAWIEAAKIPAATKARLLRRQ
ncbi:MAG: hypothetical protein JNL39_12000 [Opitutaceae bacterium]|nr:hypothetical protein [Opitutaceae bacterium]